MRTHSLHPVAAHERLLFLDGLDDVDLWIHTAELAAPGRPCLRSASCFNTSDQESYGNKRFSGLNPATRPIMLCKFGQHVLTSGQEVMNA